MSSLSEETLIVPAELTRRCKGLTLDLGLFQIIFQCTRISLKNLLELQNSVFNLAVI
jgi:hypothetical protein